MSEPLIITTEPRENHQLAMTVELGPERTAAAVHRGARALAQKARIPGFRPGKAPDATVLRLFGRERVLNEILEDLGEEVLQEALSVKEIEPYSQISLEEVATDPIRFKVVVPLKPTVELGDYHQIRLEAPTVSVGPEDVDALIENEREERATLQVVERPAQLGDTVTVDITGTVGEETIMDNHDWELVLKGEGGWLPGFDEAFVGMSAGEEKRFTLTYPEDSASRYRGQEVTFQAKVLAVKARVKPELTDEFAKSLGDFESVDDMRAKLLERLKAQREQEARNRFTDQAVQALVDGAKISYPPSAVDETVDEIIHELEDQVRQIGYKLEDYFRFQGMTEETYRQRVRPAAERRLKGQLALTELMRREQIEVTEEEITAELKRIFNISEEGGEDSELMQSDAVRRAIKASLLSDKTLARLREIVTATDRPQAEPAAESAPQPEAIAEAQNVVATDEPQTEPAAESAPQSEAIADAQNAAATDEPQVENS
ncbi:MAG: trigger factor [Anaerolineae bacterium]